MPDPRKGVFETLLVLDGRPVEWEAHMARLRASLAELFPDRTAPDISLDEPLDGDAVRIDVAPAGDRLVVRVATRRVEPHASVSLHSVTVPGGLGAHKWADRSPLDEAQAALPDGALPLVVDEDETVLEASRANLFAVRTGTLLTSPLDGRILPGITRGRVIEIAESSGIPVREEPLSREDLLAADEVFLTGSVRGVEPVASLDGMPLAGAGEKSATLFG